MQQVIGTFYIAQERQTALYYYIAINNSAASQQVNATDETEHRVKQLLDYVFGYAV